MLTTGKLSAGKGRRTWSATENLRTPGTGSREGTRCTVQQQPPARKARFLLLSIGDSLSL